MGDFVQFKGYKLAPLATACKVIRRELKNMEGAFVRWNGEAQGGQLTKRVSRAIAEEIRSGLLDNTIFHPGRPGKDPGWELRLEQLGAEKPAFLGLGATLTLVNAIDSFSSGRGGYAVGIRMGDKMPVEVTDRDGNTVRYADESVTVQKVANWLEMGTEKQAPRPWFFRGFWKYVEDKLPQDIEDTILKNMAKSLKKARAAAHMKKNVADLQPEDFYTAWVGPCPPGVQPARMHEMLGSGQTHEDLANLTIQAGEATLETTLGKSKLRTKTERGVTWRVFTKQGVEQFHSYWDAARKEWIKINPE